MEEQRKDRSLDELLSDIRRLIDDIDAPLSPAQTEEEEVLDELLQGRELPQSDPTERLDFGGLLDAEPEPEPESPVQFHQTRWTDRQKVPRHVAKLQKNQEQAYADWLYEQEQREPVAPPEPTPPQTPKKQRRPQSDETPILPPKEKKPGKKRHGFRNFLIFLLVLALLVTAAAVFLLPRQPKTDLPIAARREDVSTILLLGVDEGGARTDTVMLLTLDRAEGEASLVSIPRDTLVNGGYAVPKLNSVYGANNGGDEGIEMVMTRVSQCIGYHPDGYVLFRLDTFVNFVDALGGVTFDVATDMYYNDPSQELYIALEHGRQTLTGEQAMGLVRFRSGYADADLGRVQVQRQFLSALMEQAVSIKGMLRSPKLLRVLLTGAQTDLSVGNFLWLAETALTIDLGSTNMATLPGTPRSIDGGSYYVLDPESVAQTVNTYCNPYAREITAADLEIRTQ